MLGVWGGVSSIRGRLWPTAGLGSMQQGLWVPGAAAIVGFAGGRRERFSRAGPSVSGQLGDVSLADENSTMRSGVKAPARPRGLTAIVSVAWGSINVLG